MCRTGYTKRLKEIWQAQGNGLLVFFFFFFYSAINDTPRLKVGPPFLCHSTGSNLACYFLFRSTYQQASVELFSLKVSSRNSSCFYFHSFRVQDNSSLDKGECVSFFLMGNHLVLMTKTTSFVLEKTFSTISEWGSIFDSIQERSIQYINWTSITGIWFKPCTSTHP